MHRSLLPALLLVAVTATSALAQGGEKRPEFPPFDKVAEGYQKVVSTADGAESLFTIWKRDKDGQMLAELPRSYTKDRYFFAMTVASGERFAGLQAGDLYCYWRRYDKRLALVQPNLEIRSTGDSESKSSVNRLFTDRILLDIPIECMGPGGGPVIDLDGLLLGKASTFFGRSATGLNPRLAKIDSAKAFPENVEVGFEVPVSGGVLKSLHYSISVIKKNPAYKPRAADSRVGFFTTSYEDYGKYQDDDVRTRYINRWHLEKADPKLKLSPPKEPIVFYVEHTTPIRYRRFVAEGILDWNEAFERIGILNAIEVRYQDASTGAHMDKDPEDVRYNFVRWLNNDVGTAIGPSRVDPMTGEILDADIVLTDGWIRSFETDFSKLLPELATEGMSAETLQWLERNPSWDPRVLFASPADRTEMIQHRHDHGPTAFGGHAAAHGDHQMLGDDEFDGLLGRVSQVNGLCMAADGKSFDLAIMRMHLAMLRSTLLPKEGEEDEEPKEDMLDGMPASFIGPLLADLVCHEVGHTLGLRHNFKASSLYTLEEINSEAVKGKPFTGSVMDYTPININMDPERIQGDYAMTGPGPYDLWAIEYGYTFDKKLDGILARCVEPELAYLTDEDTSGPDPFARRYDFTKNPLDYAESQMELARWHRERILDRFVQDGDSWSKSRAGYNLTLSLHMRAVGIVSNWLGGAHISRAKKGDATDAPPIQVVEASTQRDALRFVIENTFRDEAFGLSPELLSHMTVDKWIDGGFRAMLSDSSYPVHDQIRGIQASALSQMMNPTTLRRVYDGEVYVPSDEDAFTLSEMMAAIVGEIWSDLDSPPSAPVSPRQPAISSLRRGLQLESIGRLTDLSLMDAGASTSMRTISSLARMHCNEVASRIGSYLRGQSGSIDDYTRAHLEDCQNRLMVALEAQVVTPKSASF
ncbi:MAG: zinc-dependent metalloprotease [Planctomycetota bacterium]